MSAHAHQAAGAGPSNGPGTATAAAAAQAAAAARAASASEAGAGAGSSGSSTSNANAIEPPPVFASRGIKQRVSYFYDRELLSSLQSAMRSSVPACNARLTHTSLPLLPPSTTAPSRTPLHLNRSSSPSPPAELARATDRPAGHFGSGRGQLLVRVRAPDEAAPDADGAQPRQQLRPAALHAGPPPQARLGRADDALPHQRVRRVPPEGHPGNRRGPHRRRTSM